MKTWLLRFRISAARDARTALPENLRRKIERAPELKQEQENVDALERALRESRSDPVAPAFLHASIMRAVQSSQSGPNQAVSPRAARWLLIPGLALILALVILALHWELRRPEVSSLPLDKALSSPAAALRLGDSMASTIPLVSVAPLADELARVNLDVTNAANYLIASMP